MEKNFTGGSDDHTGIKVASKYTEVAQANNIEDLLDKITVNGEGNPVGWESSPAGLAYNLYSIGYQFYIKKFNIERFINKDSTLKVIDKLLIDKDREASLISKIVYNIRDNKNKKAVNSDDLTNSIKRILDRTILKELPDIAENITLENREQKWFQIANCTINKGLSHLMDYLLSTAKRGNVFDIFHTFGSVGSLYFLMSPYFISYSIYERDKNFTHSIIDDFTLSKKEVKIAHFTDTFYDINGVAKTLQQTQKIATKLGKNLTIITCENTNEDNYKNIAGEKVFNPVGQCEVPEYPELKFNYPPFLEMLEYCYNGNFTHIHCATPDQLA